MTVRDDVWDAALEAVAATGAFRRSDLGFAPEQRYTVLRTLREMETHGWLSRTSSHSPIWRAGPKARERLRLSDDALAAADPDE